MNGTIQTKAGRLNYYAVLDYIDEATCQRKRPWINTGVSVKGNNKRLANEKLKEIMLEYEEKIAQNVDLSNDILFTDYLKEWLENYKVSIEAVTYSCYGFLASGSKTRKVKLCRKLLGIRKWRENCVNLHCQVK